MEEALNPEFVERCRQAIDIDWSQVTPDMFVPADQWEKQMRDFIDAVCKPRLLLIEQMLAAYLVEMDLQPSAIEHLVIAERPIEDGVTLLSVDWIRSPHEGLQTHEPRWATDAFDRLQSKELQAHLEVMAAGYREATDIPAHEAMLAETKNLDGTYTWHFAKRSF